MTRPRRDSLARVAVALLLLGSPWAPGADPSSTASNSAPSAASQSLVGPDRHPVQRLALDPMKVTRIFVARDRLTTLRFPSPIASLESALITADSHPEALFQVHFQNGEPYFSVRALVPNATTTLNVVWQDQTLVLELVESSTPWLSVIFHPPPTPSTRTPSTPLSPSQLLGRLDVAKAYGLLRQQHPTSVAGIEVARPNTTRDYGEYSVRIEEVFRFDADDLLVFRIVLRNLTDTPIHFVPASLMVRVGTRFFPQSITDATGVLPSQVEVPIYLAIAGSPDGSRADLSPHNDFLVMLNRVPAANLPNSNPPSASAARPPAAPNLGTAPAASSSATNRPSPSMAPVRKAPLGPRGGTRPSWFQKWFR